MEKKPLMLAGHLRLVIGLAAVTNLVIGLLFLFGPELGFALWPSPLPREIMRFIGSIVAAMIFLRPTWENARVLIAVAFVYGTLVFLSLLVDLLTVGAPQIFWIYLVVNTIFLLPAGYLFWQYDHTA
jgi:hypothetical protein